MMANLKLDPSKYKTNKQTNDILLNIRQISIQGNTSGRYIQGSQQNVRYLIRASMC